MLRQLKSPTTTVNFVAGEFKRFVENSSLEELRLGFAGGIPVEEMESIVKMKLLRIGMVQFDAVPLVGKIGAGLDLNKLADQQVG